MTPGRARPSDRLDRFERLAAVGAVADGPTLGRPEEVLDDRSARTAVRARDAWFEIDETAGRGRNRPLAGRRDTRGQQRSTTGRADALRGPRDLERGRDLDRAPEGTQPLGDRRLDELERRAADEGRQDLDADRAAPVAGPTSTRWMIPRSITESIGSSGSITSVSAARTAASSTAGSAAGRGTPAIAAERARATPIWIPASLTRSPPGRRAGPT